MKLVEKLSRPPRPFSGSMVRRMTWFYTVSAFALLCLGTGCLYWVLEVELREQDTQAMSDEFSTIATILREHPGNLSSLRIEVELESSARSYARFFVRVLNAPNQILMETPRMRDEDLTPDRFPIAPQTMGLLNPIKWTSSSGNTYLLATKQIYARPAGGEFTVQLAFDISNEEGTLKTYRHWIVLVLVTGVLTSALLGMNIARRGLRPLEHITRAAQTVTAQQLSARVATTGWPDELTMLASEFDRMLGRLEESFARLSQFSADIAHELRTPINNLMGEAEVALSRSRTAEDYRSVLESALEEYNRLARMIDSLLFIARAEKLHAPLQRVPFDVGTEVDSMIDFYEALAEEQQVAIRRHGDATLAADLILFRRALSNVISNAVHYTPAGGRINVEIQSLDGTVQVSVRDTGCGIAPEHLAKIFDRFYRVDPSRTHRTHGTGLGLSIVKSIVELHDGKIFVESDPGHGTVVTLAFPNSLAPTATAPLALPANAESV
jgi:two-component system, OmpR family, heavy metal sensor histidine kinase CusS